MDAIEIGLRSLGVKPGDEVITTAMTAFATVLAIVRSGGTPVFADIDPATGLMSLDSAIRCINKSTVAIVLVHLYGHVNELSKWKNECLSRGVALVEDCAQAHGARWNGLAAGTFGALGAYSFYPTKNLGALGDAGAIVTMQEHIEFKSRQILNYGQSEKYFHEILGVNSRLDEIQAAILIERLSYLQQFIDKRRSIAESYRKYINNPLVLNLLPPNEEENHVYHLYVIKTQKRGLLADHLMKNGIATLSHYPIPAHKQKANFNFKVDAVGLINTELHAQLCLSIPCNPQMSDQDVQHVINTINEFN
jgi:dTDP-4-amino-4,6-dideoxygalactose transaminase